MSAMTSLDHSSADDVIQLTPGFLSESSGVSKKKLQEETTLLSPCEGWGLVQVIKDKKKNGGKGRTVGI